MSLNHNFFYVSSKLKWTELRNKFSNEFHFGDNQKREM